MIFRVLVPGFGELFVDGSSTDEALASVRRFLGRNRIRLEEGSQPGNPRIVARSEVGDGILLDNAGLQIDRDQERESIPSADGRPRLFRFDVPVIGDLFVLAGVEGEAVGAGTVHLSAIRDAAGIPSEFRLNTPEELNVDELPVSADPAFVIDSTGRSRADLIAGTVAGDEPVEFLAPDSRTFTQVAKLIGPSDRIRFIRVAAPNTDRAREIIEPRLTPNERVPIISSAEFLLANDRDFAEQLQSRAGGDLEQFLASLGLVEADDNESERRNPRREDPGAAVPLPFDVQDFPFASFQNAVEEFGFDPEGVLSGTLNQRFQALAPVARIGSLTGSIDPIGQSPGALEHFFADRFGDLDIAAETFRDLLAGRSQEGLEPGRLLAFNALVNPDISTGAGRGDAADVFDLARAAAEDRFGSFVASQLLPSNSRLFRELERQLAGGDPATAFLDFARQQNLLPA